MKIEVGKTYETKSKGSYECIAVTEKHAWMKSSETASAYVWTHDGKAVSLSSGYDIKPKAREFWIGDFGCAFIYPISGAIHVREVLPE